MRAAEYLLHFEEGAQALAGTHQVVALLALWRTAPNGGTGLVALVTSLGGREKGGREGRREGEEGREGRRKGREEGGRGDEGEDGGENMEEYGTD